MCASTPCQSGVAAPGRRRCGARVGGLRIPVTCIYNNCKCIYNVCNKKTVIT